jgi:hypothetical protein
MSTRPSLDGFGYWHHSGRGRVHRHQHWSHDDGWEGDPADRQERDIGKGTYFARVKGGKIVEFNSYPDIAGMMMQLGFMPQM